MWCDLFDTMAVLRALLVALTTLAARSHSVQVPINAKAGSDISILLEPQIIGGFNLIIAKNDEHEVIGHIGRTLFGTFSFENVEDGVSVMVGNVNLTINAWVEDEGRGHGIRISWIAETNTRLEDCFNFGSKQWYGGPMQAEQIYPLQSARMNYAGYVTRESDNGAIAERYWLNSAGEYYYVHPNVPLFVDYGNLLTNHICFAAQLADPYSINRNKTQLIYDIWFLSNPKIAHQHAVETYLGKPSALPDFRMVERPIWSTWAQYSREIDERNLMEFANVILDNGFGNAQFEIDDLWEVCYGSLTVNDEKFSNFTKLVQDLKSLGFRVTIWAHPFINIGCEPWYSEALENGYLVLNENGSPNTTWWNNNGSIPAHVDFTNPRAAEWWSDRVRNILTTYDIDSVKFDAGESSWSPQIPVQQGDVDLHPHNIVDAYVKTCATFGNMIEVRTGFMTQDLPVYVRMVDKDSVWGLTNGLSTVVTTALQMNLNGYTFVLPDMIGGNGLNLANELSVAQPSKELFIRWVQANTFLPVMQYSFVPWNFDNETTQICKKYTELHAEYAEYIYDAMNASVVNGSPVNAPLWWADPTDAITFDIWDEFLLGDNILVAPVLTEGAVSRDIYLPAGVWYAEGDKERIFEGGQWLVDYPAPLDTLPYFIREPVSTTGSAVTSTAAILLILHAIVINYIL